MPHSHQWTELDRKSIRQQKSKMIQQSDLTDMLKIFHPKKQNTSSSAPRAFSRTTRWGTKTSLNKFNRTEIISSIFSDHNCMNLDINPQKKKWKKQNQKTQQHGIKQYATKISMGQQ